MIIGLTGYARSGKDSVAKVLVDHYGFIRLAFADPIRDLLLEVNPILDKGNRLSSLVDEYGWDIAKAQPEVRRLLQTLGVGARKVFGENHWIDQTLKHIPSAAYYLNNFVITDVRFKNEADAIKNNVHVSSHIWRVERPGVGAINNHISESEMSTFTVDQTFVNDGTLEDLEAMIKARMVGLLV